MSDTIIIALLSFAGSGIATLRIMISKLSNYRIELLNTII